MTLELRPTKDGRFRERSPNPGEVRYIRHHLDNGTLVYLRQQSKEVNTCVRGPLLVWATTRSVVEDTSGRAVRGGDVRVKNVVATAEIREASFENVWTRAREV